MPPTGTADVSRRMCAFVLRRRWSRFTRRRLVPRSLAAPGGDGGAGATCPFRDGPDGTGPRGAVWGHRRRSPPRERRRCRWSRRGPYRVATRRRQRAGSGARPAKCPDVCAGTPSSPPGIWGRRSPTRPDRDAAARAGLTLRAARSFYGPCMAPRRRPCRGVAQLARAPVSKTGGWGFETLHPCPSGISAQVGRPSPDRAGPGWHRSGKRGKHGFGC